MYTHLTKMVVTFLKVMRHEKLKIRADQEPALKALIGMVKEQWPHRILVEESPLYSSQSNGRAERAIQTVRRLAASLRVATELRYEMALSSGMVAWPWLIRHAAWLHNGFHVKYNGRTCYEELYPDTVQERGSGLWRVCALHGALSGKQAKETREKASKDGRKHGARHLAWSHRRI